jgi:hypothetical protein
MEPALGRRLSRLAVTLWVAVPALIAVALWADPDWARVFYAFVALTAGALTVASLVVVSLGSHADPD